MAILDAVSFICLAAFAVFLLVAIIIQTLIKINRFRRNLDQIDCEIGRTFGEERQYWLRKRKKLLKSLIPFYKLFHR